MSIFEDYEQKKEEERMEFWRLFVLSLSQGEQLELMKRVSENEDQNKDSLNSAEDALIKLDCLMQPGERKQLIQIKKDQETLIEPKNKSDKSIHYFFTRAEFDDYFYKEFGMKK